MASAPQSANLPLFYKDLMPLNSRDHGTWRARPMDKAPWLVGQHAVPLTVEEFPQAQRNFPIIFASGDNPVPLALMGLNEGVNVFVEEDGKITEPIYVPAYARRYPFLLAKLTPDTQELSLCFDPTCDIVGDFSDGEALFADGEPSEATRNALNFCESFEAAGQKTASLVEELQKHQLLMEGEVAIQQPGVEAPFVYRGFQMVDQEKLKEMRGDVLRGWNQNGIMAVIYAHLFSLELVRDIFGRQTLQGKGPVVAEQPADATA